MIQRTRLLVIDDDDDFRGFVSEILRNDFFIVPASDGKSGLAQAVSNLPNMILLDMEMPGWDGVQTLQAIRQNPKLKTLPVMILSARSDWQAVLEAKESGADDYLLKNPNLKEDLGPRLKSLLEKTKWRQLN